MTEPGSAGFTSRLVFSWYRRQSLQREELTQQTFADEVSRAMQAMGIAQSFTQGAVSRWLRGGVPRIDVIEAIASCLGVDPGWLAFGDHSSAESPENPMRPGIRPLGRPDPDRPDGEE